MAKTNGVPAGAILNLSTKPADDRAFVAVDSAKHYMQRMEDFSIADQVRMQRLTARFEAAGLTGGDVVLAQLPDAVITGLADDMDWAVRAILPSVSEDQWTKLGEGAQAPILVAFSQQTTSGQPAPTTEHLTTGTP